VKAKPMPAEALVDLRRRLTSLPPRSAATRQVIREVAAAYDVSESTVYRALTPRPAPRAVQRVDQGTPRVLPVEQLEQYCEVTYSGLKAEAFTLAAGQPKRTGQPACTGRATSASRSAVRPQPEPKLWFVPETFYA